jgi:hypothetical protein
MAADVSGNGTVTALDATYILRYRVGLLQRFPAADLCGSDWLFIPLPESAANQSIMMPDVRAGMCQPGSVSYSPLAAQADGQDFLAILLGDVNGSWMPSPPTMTVTQMPQSAATPTPTA